MVIDTPAPDKGIPVRICLYFCAVDKKLFSGHRLDRRRVNAI